MVTSPLLREIEFTAVWMVFQLFSNCPAENEPPLVIRFSWRGSRGDFCEYWQYFQDEGVPGVSAVAAVDRGDSVCELLAPPVDLVVNRNMDDGVPADRVEFADVSLEADLHGVGLSNTSAQNPSSCSSRRYAACSGCQRAHLCCRGTRITEGRDIQIGIDGR